MIDIFASNPLAKAIWARRKTQRHLDCLTRQVVVCAGRQAIALRVRSRTRRRSSPRLYRHELADRLAFEKWSELDTLAHRLAWQQQVLDELKLCGDPAFPPVAG